MDAQDSSVLDLDSLGNGVPIFLNGAERFLVQSSMVCFDCQGHKSGVTCQVQFGRKKYTYQIVWAEEITEQHRRAYADLQDAVEDSAVAIALLLVRELTEYTAIERARKGTTVDYFLTVQGRDDDLIFNDSARLEVSGILEEKGGNTVENRVKSKLLRLKQFDDGQPTFIVVVEHGRPWVKMVKHYE